MNNNELNNTVEPTGSTSKCEKWIGVHLYPQVAGPKIVKAYFRSSDVEGIFRKDNEILLRVKDLGLGAGFRDYKIKETDADGELLKALDASDIMDWLFKELGLSDVVELPLDIIGKSGTARHLRIEN